MTNIGIMKVAESVSENQNIEYIGISSLYGNEHGFGNLTKSISKCEKLKSLSFKGNFDYIGEFEEGLKPLLEKGKLLKIRICFNEPKIPKWDKIREIIEKYKKNFKEIEIVKSENLLSMLENEIIEQN